MRTTRLTAVLVGLAAIAMVTADAHAVYHPTLGRFLQRDPAHLRSGGRVGNGVVLSTSLPDRIALRETPMLGNPRGARSRRVLEVRRQAATRLFRTVKTALFSHHDCAEQATLVNDAARWSRPEGRR